MKMDKNFMWFAINLFVAVGALNWGFALFNFNLVSFLDKLVFNSGMLIPLLYALIGISGGIKLLQLFGLIKRS